VELLLSLAAIGVGVVVLVAWSRHSERRHRARRSQGGAGRDSSGTDLLAELDRRDPAGATTRPVRVTVCVLRLASVVAAAAGPLTESRIQAILGLFVSPDTPPSLLTIMMKAVAEARAGVDVDATCTELARWTDIGQRRGVFTALRRVAESDGPPRAEAHKVLVALMVKLGLPEPEVEAYIDEASRAPGAAGTGGSAGHPPDDGRSETVH